MVSIQETKLALRSVLLDSSLIEECDIAFEGIEFEPGNKSLWLKESILNIDQHNITRCTENFEGIYILQIFVSKKTPADLINNFADMLNDIYNPEESYMSFNGVDVFVHDTELGNLVTDDKWQFKNFSSYFRSVNREL